MCKHNFIKQYKLNNAKFPKCTSATSNTHVGYVWSEEFTEVLDHANYLQPKNDETLKTIHSTACNVGKILDGLPSLRQSATVRVGKKHI